MPSQNLETDGRGIWTRQNRTSAARPGELDSGGEFQHIGGEDKKERIAGNDSEKHMKREPFNPGFTQIAWNAAKEEAREAMIAVTDHQIPSLTFWGHPRSLPLRWRCFGSGWTTPREPIPNP